MREWLGAMVTGGLLEYHESERTYSLPEAYAAGPDPRGDVIHDQSHPDVVLANVNRALKPGGDFLMQDISASSELHRNEDNPLAPFIYTISCMHCMSVSLAQGGMGLGAAWGKELALEMLAEAGFANVAVHQLPHDILNNYCIMREA